MMEGSQRLEEKVVSIFSGTDENFTSRHKKKNPPISLKRSLLLVASYETKQFLVF
jgi:hypothetical protein